MPKKEPKELDKSAEPIYCKACDYFSHPDQDGNCSKCHQPVK